MAHYDHAAPSKPYYSTSEAPTEGSAMERTSQGGMLLKVAALVRRIQSDASIAEDTPARLKAHREAYAMTRKWLNMVDEELLGHADPKRPEERRRPKVEGGKLSMLGRIGMMAFRALKRKGDAAEDAATRDLLVEIGSVLKLFLEEAKQEIERLEQRLEQRPGGHRRGRRGDEVGRRKHREPIRPMSMKPASSASKPGSMGDHANSIAHGTDDILRVRGPRPVMSAAQQQMHPEHLNPLIMHEAIQPGPAQGPGDPGPYAHREVHVQGDSPSGWAYVQQPVAPRAAGESIGSKPSKSLVEQAINPQQYGHELAAEDARDVGSEYERQTLAPTISSIGSPTPCQNGLPTGEGQRLQELEAPQTTARSHVSRRSRLGSSVPGKSPVLHPVQGPASPSPTNRHDLGTQPQGPARSSCAAGAQVHATETAAPATKRSTATLGSRSATRRSRAGDVQSLSPAQILGPKFEHTPLNSSETSGHLQGLNADDKRSSNPEAASRSYASTHGHESTNSTLVQESDPFPWRASAKNSLATIEPSRHRSEDRDSAQTSIASSRKTDSQASSLGIPRVSPPSEHDHTARNESVPSAYEAHLIHATTPRPPPANPAPSGASIDGAGSIRPGMQKAGATHESLPNEAAPLGIQASRSIAPSDRHSTSRASRAASANTRAPFRKPRTASQASNVTIVSVISETRTEMPAASSIIHGLSSGRERASTHPLAASSVVHSKASWATKTSRASSHASASSGQEQPATTARPTSRVSSRVEPAAKLTAENLAELASQASSSIRSNKTRRSHGGSRTKHSATATAEEHGTGSKSGQSEAVVSEIDMGFVRPKRALKCHHPHDPDDEGYRPDFCDSVAGTDSSIVE